MKVFLILFLFCFLFLSGNSFTEAETNDLNLNIDVFQALREGVKGEEFDHDYVKIGLPFPKGTLKEVNGRPQLSIKNREFQSKVLKKWPDGSVKWALVEFLTSAGKGTIEKVQLSEGTGLSAGGFLAQEKDASVWINTGPLQVEVRKEGFNIFNRVTVNGLNIVRDGESKGIILIDGNGKEYLASRHKETRVAIEENGPVEAVIRIDGSHYSNDADKLLDYTMRLFFYKGKSRVKVQYSLRNASIKFAEHALIRALHLDTKLNLNDGVKATVSTHKGLEKLDLREGDISFYQAVSDFPWMSDGDSFYYHGPIPPDYRRESKRGYKQEGNWLWQYGKLLLEGKRNEYPDLGFIDVTDANGQGMTAGIRYMAGQWPKALKADAAGNVTVSLWPEENNEGYWIRYGSHTTYEVMYFFHSDGKSKPTEEMKRFQYPLAARAPIEWYNRNVDGIYPLYHFISFNDEKKLAANLDIHDSVGWRKPKFSVWRYHYWGHGGFSNQHDFARVALINFLRDDRDLVKAGEAYLLAESMLNYYADWAVYHSDDYDYNKIQFSPKKNNLEADLPKVVFEWEHQHWYGMPLYYYMTGEERVKEAILDWGEYIKKLSNPLSLIYMRVFATGMFSLAAMYEFTGDQEFLRLADMNFTQLLKAKYNDKNPYENIFINWERGYVAGGSGSGWPRVKADLMLGSLLYDGILNYYSFMDSNNPLRDDAYKLLMKVSEFMYREPYVEGIKNGKWAYWIPYEYDLKNPEKSDQGYKLVGQASFWVVFPFMLTGESRWIERMKKMMKMAINDGSGAWGSFGYVDHPGFQTIAYILQKKLAEQSAKTH